MDANGSRLFMMLGEADWSCCADENGVPFSKNMKSGPEEYLESTEGLGWDSTHSEVILHPRLAKFKAAPRDIPPTMDDRRGAARDRYGNFYWIDSNGNEILVRSSGTGITTHFWSSTDQEPQPEEVAAGEFCAKESPPTMAPCEFGGLAVTEDHFLIVGVIKPAGLLVFDLHAGGPPRLMLWPESVAFVPFDMSAAPGGGAWVLDRENKRFWFIDRKLSVVNYGQSPEVIGPKDVSDFSPASGPSGVRKPELFPTGIPLPVPSPLAASDPVSIESFPDCTVLILDRDYLGTSAVTRYRFGRQLGNTILLGQSGFAAHDLVFVPEHESSDGVVPDRLYVASSEGNQVYAFDISRDEQENLILKLVNEFYPMRLFGGKGLIASGSEIYYDSGSGWVPLVQQPRPQYTVAGSLDTPHGNGRPAFDAGVPDCIWHRLTLDASIPPGTEVGVYSRAANDYHELDLAEWREEPPLHLRGDGSELPFVPRDSRKDAGTWELLFQGAVGRFLQVRLTFHGNGRETPRLRCLRAYAPRFSYLKEYLPAVYREDESSASFLDRFLANFEGTLTAIEDKIAAVQILFDARSAPGEALDWLAGWLGVTLDPKWDESKRRLFIREAMAFFSMRGTIRGIQLALRLALDECIDESAFEGDAGSCHSACGGIRIVEKFRTRRAPPVMLGDPTDAGGLRPATPSKRWIPSQGREALLRQYQKEFNLAGTGQMPLSTAAAPVQKDWKKFVEKTTGLVPSSTTRDNALWQEFLARRYRQPSAMNFAYGSGTKKGLGSFADAELPETLPTDGAPLVDWYEFQAVVVAAQRLAHQFTVLLPLRGSESGDSEAQREKLEIARRIIELQKPVHTVFDVKFYWDLFRVGMVRLGIDTVLDAGSRSPYLVSPAVLGRGYLLESYLAPGHPQNVSDRLVLGRDRLGT